VLDYGAPTTRKRLFLIARCDGQPIVWPEKSDELALTDYRVAADLIQWERPTYSIFLTNEEGKQLRREAAARREHDAARLSRLREVRREQPAAVHRRLPRRRMGRRRRALARHEPMRADHRHQRDATTHALHAAHHRARERIEPAQLARRRAAAHAMRAGEGRALRARRAVHGAALRRGPEPEARRGGLGQAPRARSVALPMPTIVPSQNGAQLVAAFLAKHNGGHEATGQSLAEGVHTSSRARTRRSSPRRSSS
jgi:DNA (cytosine-5)-methyltransferase 1